MNYVFLVSVVVVVLLVVIIAITVHTRRLIRIGVGIMQNTVSYEQYPAQPSQRILVLGDSSGVGVGARVPQESVAGQLGADFPQADITNISVSGAKVEDLLAQLTNAEARIGATRFDLVILHIGGNDVVRGTNFTQLETQLNEVLGALEQNADAVVLIHGGDVGTAKLLPFGTRWWFTMRTNRLREVYQRIDEEREKTYYADVIGSEEGQRFANDANATYAPDSFHPGSEGYAVWYRVITKIILKNSLLQ